MNQKVNNALSRLNNILPLAKALSQCSEPTKHLYHKILRSFMSKGGTLSKKDMSPHVNDINSAIRTLASKDLVQFSSDGRAIAAYPFTMEPRDYKVFINNTDVNAMCALDALAISPMFGAKVTIHTHCQITSTPIVIEQSGMTFLNASDISGTCLCIDWGATKEGSRCSSTLCTHMFFVKNSDIANHWQRTNIRDHEVFSLEEAASFSRQFFVPLIEKQPAF